MPRREHSQRRRTGALTPADSSVLRFGRAWLGLPSFISSDPEQVREAWEAWGEQILAQWLLEPHRSGQRPWAWWRVEQGREKPHRLEEDEAAMLRSMGQLTEQEETILARWEADRVARFGDVEESHAKMRRLHRERQEREKEQQNE